jgi:hypothetical protein
VIAALAVSVKEHEEKVAEEEADASDTQEVMSDATAQTMVQAPERRVGNSAGNPRMQPLRQVSRVQSSPGSDFSYA